MATGYIIWDSKNRVLVGGPFTVQADADTFLARRAKKVDSQETAKTSKNTSAQFTRETVTLN